MFCLRKTVTDNYMALWVLSEPVTYAHKDCRKGTCMLCLCLHSKKKIHCKECCRLHIASAFSLREVFSLTSLACGWAASTKAPPSANRGNMEDNVQLAGALHGVTADVLYLFPPFLLESWPLGVQSGERFIPRPSGSSWPSSAISLPLFQNHHPCT